MVAHQYIGMDAASIPLAGFFEYIEVETIVFIRGKNNIPVVTTLDDVLRFARQEEVFKKLCQPFILKKRGLTHGQKPIRL